MQALDNKPEELAPSPEVRRTQGAKGDLKLLAEEQVLDDEAPTAAGRVRASRVGSPITSSADRRAPLCPTQLVPPPQLGPGGRLSACLYDK